MQCAISSRSLRIIYSLSKAGLKKRWAAESVYFRNDHDWGTTTYRNLQVSLKRNRFPAQVDALHQIGTQRQPVFRRVFFVSCPLLRWPFPSWKYRWKQLGHEWAIFRWFSESNVLIIPMTSGCEVMIKFIQMCIPFIWRFPEMGVPPVIIHRWFVLF